jgi:hypothetical protein
LQAPAADDDDDDDVDLFGEETEEEKKAAAERAAAVKASSKKKECMLSRFLCIFFLNYFFVWELYLESMYSPNIPQK